MPQLTGLHIDQPLTDVSVMYRNEDYVNDILMPDVPVNKRSDKYFIYGKENLAVTPSLRRPRGVAAEIEWTLSTDAYYAEERALRVLVTDQEKQEADDPISPEIDATEILTDKLMLDEEVQCANLLTSNTNLTNYVALSGTSQWSDYVNSTPLVNIKTGKISVKASIMKSPNTFFVPYEVGQTLADHPSIKDLIKYTASDALTTSGLPPVLRGLRVVEASVYQNTANEGQTATMASVWGKNAIILYLTPAPKLKTVSLGYQFLAPDSTTGVRGWAVRRYRDEPRKGDIVEVSSVWDNKLIAVGAGYLMQTAIA